MNDIKNEIFNKYTVAEVAQCIADMGFEINVNGVKYMKGTTDATEKQLALINKIESELGVVFKGNTLVEASNFINENIEYLKGEKPTEKQLNCIKYIEKNTGKKFKGKTKKSANNFINENLKDSKYITSNKIKCKGSGNSYTDYGGWGMVSPYDIYDQYDMPLPF